MLRPIVRVLRYQLMKDAGDLLHCLAAPCPFLGAGLLPRRFACWGSMFNLCIDLPAH